VEYDYEMCLDIYEFSAFTKKFPTVIPEEIKCKYEENSLNVLLLPFCFFTF